MNKKIIDIIKFVKNNPQYKYKIRLSKNGVKEEFRFFIKNGLIFYYPKGAKYYGYCVSPEFWDDIELIVEDISQKWNDKWSKIFNEMVENNLWPELRDNIKIALDKGYDKNITIDVLKNLPEIKKISVEPSRLKKAIENNTKYFEEFYLKNKAAVYFNPEKRELRYIECFSGDNTGKLYIGFSPLHSFYYDKVVYRNFINYKI